MTSIVDALPMPMPTPTSSSPSSVGAPGVPPEEVVEDIAADPAAPADAFAALLAAVVATVVPQVTHDLPATEPAAVLPGAGAPAAPVMGVGVPVDVAPVLSNLHASMVTAVAPEPAVQVPTAPAAVEPPLPEAAAPTLLATPEAHVETATAAQAVVEMPASVVPTPAPQPEVDAATPAVPVPDATTPAVDLPEAVTPTPATTATPTPPEDPQPEPVVTSMEAPSNLQPVGTTRITTVEAVPVPASPAPAPPPPAQQVITQISPLLERPDGTYELSLRLHPDELGGVHVEVRMQGGEVSLQLRAETQVGHTTLRESLPALRAELEAAGVHAGTLDLGDWGNGQHSAQDTPDRRSGSATPFTIEAPTTDVDLSNVDDGDSAVDVRI